MRIPLIISVAAAALLGLNLHADETQERIDAMQEQIKMLQSELDAIKSSHSETEKTLQSGLDAIKSSHDKTKKTLKYYGNKISELKKDTWGNHLKLDVDFRTAVENLQYEMADGSDQSNDAFLTNRFWLNMNWAATDRLSFTGQLAYNKAYGYRSGFGGNNPGFDTFDWITNENAYDDVVRVRSAYFFYNNDTFFGTEVPWTFSIGRRASTNGRLVNLRDDDHAASPMGHNINVEFDGFSSLFGLENVTGVSGMYVKFCAGRGATNANARFFTVSPQDGTPYLSAPYVKNESDIPDIDLGGVIYVPYDNGQYSVGTQYYYATHLIDADIEVVGGNPVFKGITDVGNMHALTANFTANGIGNEWSDFLDNTIFFVSAAVSITDPKENGQGMLGSTNSKTGSSFWVGTQFPSLITEDGRWGLEYNHGDKYWRSVTYAEDTNIGSKLAARGNAYEAYFTEYLIGKILSMQLRYTYIDYDYAGSNGFFGSTTGTPVKINDLTGPSAAMNVDTAQDIRFYLRYRY